MASVTYPLYIATDSLAVLYTPHDNSKLILVVRVHPKMLLHRRGNS